MTQLDTFWSLSRRQKNQKNPTINNRILNGYVAPDNASLSLSKPPHYLVTTKQTVIKQPPRSRFSLSLSEKAKTCLLPALTNRTKVSSVLATLLYLLLPFHSPSNVFPSVLSKTSSHQPHQHPTR